MWCFESFLLRTKSATGIGGRECCHLDALTIPYTIAPTQLTISNSVHKLSSNPASMPLNSMICLDEVR